MQRCSCNCRFLSWSQEVEQSWKLLRIQTSLSNDWNYKILKIDYSVQLLDIEGKKVSFFIRPVYVALGHPYHLEEAK